MKRSAPIQRRTPLVRKTPLRRSPIRRKRPRRGAPDAAALDYMGRVKALPCFVCGAPGPSYAHHIRAGQGKSERASDYLTIPLCLEHHQGRTGIHGDRSAWLLRKIDELDGVADTIRRLVHQ
jgi:hypothetical protein